jgi:hypothetical protein
VRSWLGEREGLAQLVERGHAREAAGGASDAERGAGPEEDVAIYAHGRRDDSIRARGAA